MSELWLSLISLVIGIAATILVSRYYFRRSFTKSLTPYILLSSAPLKGVDPQVRKELEIRYQGHPIQELNEIQFLIANTGDKAIRDVIEPLTLTVSNQCRVLDATLLYVDPAGRSVEVSIYADRRQVIFRTPLLNSGEFFIVKLLLDGNLKQEELVFTITADELPPRLTSSWLPPDAIGTIDKRGFQLPILLGGVVVLAMGVGVSYLIYDQWTVLPRWDSLNLWAYLATLLSRGWPLILSIPPALVFVLFGIMMTLGSFTDGSFPPPKKRFTVPEDRLLSRARGFGLGQRWNHPYMRD